MMKNFKFLFSIEQITLILLGAQQKQNRKAESKFGNKLRESRKIRLFYGQLPLKYLKKVINKSNLYSPHQRNETIFTLLESRLDVVTYRSGFFESIATAKQWILAHGVYVNKKKVVSPGTIIVPGDVISVFKKGDAKQKKQSFSRLLAALPFKIKILTTFGFRQRLTKPLLCSPLKSPILSESGAKTKTFDFNGFRRRRLKAKLRSKQSFVGETFSAQEKSLFFFENKDKIISKSYNFLSNFANLSKNNYSNDVNLNEKVKQLFVKVKKKKNVWRFKASPFRISLLKFSFSSFKSKLLFKKGTTFFSKKMSAFKKKCIATYFYRSNKALLSFSKSEVIRKISSVYGRLWRSQFVLSKADAKQQNHYHSSAKTINFINRSSQDFTIFSLGISGFSGEGGDSNISNMKSKYLQKPLLSKMLCNTSFVEAFFKEDDRDFISKVKGSNANKGNGVLYKSVNDSQNKKFFSASLSNKSLVFLKSPILSSINIFDFKGEEEFNGLHSKALLDERFKASNISDFKSKDQFLKSTDRKENRVLLEKGLQNSLDDDHPLFFRDDTKKAHKTEFCLQPNKTFRGRSYLQYKANLFNNQIYNFLFSTYKLFLKKQFIFATNTKRAVNNTNSNLIISPLTFLLSTVQRKQCNKEVRLDNVKIADQKKRPFRFKSLPLTKLTHNNIKLKNKISCFSRQKSIKFFKEQFFFACKKNKPLNLEISYKSVSIIFLFQPQRICFPFFINVANL